MRVPPVRERIKEAPAQALRGVFAAIGQLLLITDKLRNKPPADTDVPPARTPAPSETVTDAQASSPASREAAAKPAPAEPAPPKPQTPRDFDKTGNVRLLDDAEAAAPASAAPPASAAAPAVPGTATATPVGAAAAKSEPADSGPPLPNYDELSVASLRARLRNLDVSQVRRLAEYERAHAARADVITMFERRIAKLEAEA